MAVSAHPRTESRRRALDILFCADLLGEPATAVLDREKPKDKIARAIVNGVAGNKDEIDATIRRLSDRWTIERMPIVDRNLLRIGVYELFYEPNIPSGATVNDAVELAKMLSTEDSGRFVNGMLGRASRERPR